MSTPEEPALGPRTVPDLPAGEEDPALETRIRRLVERQPFAVLCTQGGGQPYGSLLAFAMTADLHHAVFATSRATRKYRLLMGCEQVALVVDDRSERGAALMEIEALTVTGHAHATDDSPSRDRWRELLLSRHSYLEGFVSSPSTSIFHMETTRFLHVSHFQEVRQWVPPSPA